MNSVITASNLLLNCKVARSQSTDCHCFLDELEKERWELGNFQELAEIFQ